MKKTFISLIISVSLIGSALAFSDVPQDAWFAGYVADLQESSIIDAGEFFRPAASLNRAELVKMVIEATSGIEDYEAPAHPTFDDVQEDDWFTPYVEEAATLGIVTGYTDETGSLTGMFGPADVVTRAAATKILVEAFDLATGSQEESGFYAMGPPQETEEEEVIEEEEQATGEVALPNPKSIVAAITEDGVDEILVGRYNFEANYEGFYITTVTIVNDLVGDDFGDDADGTLAVKNVILKYPDENGFLSTVKGSLLGDGKARFTGLDFFAPRYESAFLEIYAELNSFAEAGEALSGEVFRLGIQSIDNDTQNFRAIGEFSGDQITFGAEAKLSTNSNVKPFTVRKSFPTFTVDETSRDLFAGSNKLIEFEVSAASAGSVKLGRIVFEVNVNDRDASGLTLSDFRLFRNGSFVDNVVIYDASGGQDLSTAGGGSLIDGQSDIIISFDIEEIIPADDSTTYMLKASVTGSASDDRVSIRFADGDESTELSGLTAEGNYNTGKIFVNGDATADIFTVATDFSQTVGNNRNIIWSDSSAHPHAYTSSDWTNGYRLGLYSLDPVILSK